MKKTLYALLSITLMLFFLPSNIFAEKAVDQENMLGFSAPKGTTVSASSIYAGRSGEYAIDGKLDTFWNANAYSGTLVLAFPHKVSFSKVQIAALSKPKGSTYSFTFKGLKDGNWVSINTPGDATATTSLESSYEIFEPFSVSSGEYEGLLIEAANDRSWIGINEITFINEESPKQPLNLQASSGDKKIELNWNAIDDTVSYIVKRSLTQGGPYTTIATGVTGATYSDSNVENGKTYYYVVTANKKNGESKESNEASATPQGTVKPDPKPEKGDRALLTITMTTGLEKEYDISMTEVNAFIDWYEAKSNGTGTAKFMIDKSTNNKGPFNSRKDYVIFDKILTFEVNEYTTK